MKTIAANATSTVDVVIHELESDILSLRFAPGAKVTESNLAIRYNVSRNTVREAVAHLLAQGLLTKVANKGVSVRRFTVQDVQEIFHLRALLELEALETIFHIKSDVSDLYDCVALLEQIDRQQNWDDYVATDILFHSKLVDHAMSPRLSRLYQTILTEVKLCIYQTRNYVQVPTSTATSHRLILDLTSAGDQEKASSLLKEHIEHVIKRYCAGLLAMDENK